MVAFPSDYTIVGTVLAIAVAILLLSGLALYVAFRVRETLREEKGGGARAAKVGLLIGLLFLSGGMFYFFASGFNALGFSNPDQGTSSMTTSPSISSSVLSTATSSSASSSASTSTSATSSVSSQTTTTTSTSPAQSVSMPAPNCPSRVTAGQTFTCSIDVYNQGSTTFNSATIVSSGDFSKFAFLSCTESVNGGPTTSVSTSGNTVTVGSIVPGTTVLALTVQAPAQSGQYGNSVLTLDAPGLSQPISVTFTIQVTA